MSKFLQDGGNIEVVDEMNLVVHDRLPTATYTIGVKPLTEALFLQRVDSHKVEGKLYGDVEATLKKLDWSTRSMSELALVA